MSEEEQRELVGKRSSRLQQQEKTPLQRMNRKLNIAIAIVSALIIIVTTMILNSQESTVKPAKEQAEVAEKQPEPTEQAVSEQNEQDKQEESTENVENIVSESADANVQEVWTNTTWQPYPTAQTGTHTSAFELNHPDYEEKLAAAFSVIPLEQEASIVMSARNNGNDKSARIVVTNQDKSESYRVIIEWIDNEGWLPISVDVLYNVDGVK